MLRDLIKASAEIAEDVFSNGGEVEDLLDDVEQKILSISQKSLPQNFVSLKDDLTSAYERIAKLHAGGGKLRGVPTGFPALDETLSGLQKSELIILGARPSVGKTSLALDIARNAGEGGIQRRHLLARNVARISSRTASSPPNRRCRSGTSSPAASGTTASSP